MIDTDYFLAPIMVSYFLDSDVGRQRRDAFFATEATTDFGNQGLSYSMLAEINAAKVMRTSRDFAQPGGQVKENLIHLKEGEVVGEWRDSTYGIGGGRIPYNVNTAIVPAALRAIAALSQAGFFPEDPQWAQEAEAYAQVWEDETLKFFEVSVPATEARQLVEDYTEEADYGFPSNTDNITTNVVYHGLALDGNNGQSLVQVMNTDDCFRHFLLNTTNQSQLTAYINSTANNILAPFPVGLSNPVGLLVANPAYGGDPVYAANFTNSAYHGTVVWSWQMAMMAAGLERQLDRCSSAPSRSNSNGSAPEFCSDEAVYSRVQSAYNHLWNLIDDNRQYLSGEVWSWLYQDGDFVFEPLGALSETESNIRQLWSLTFLAVQRNEAFA